MHNTAVLCNFDKGLIVLFFSRISLVPIVTLFCQADGPVNRGQIKDLLVPELRVTTVLLWFIWSVSVINQSVSLSFATAPHLCIINI